MKGFDLITTLTKDLLSTRKPTVWKTVIERFIEDHPTLASESQKDEIMTFMNLQIAKARNDGKKRNKEKLDKKEHTVFIRPYFRLSFGGYGSCAMCEKEIQTKEDAFGKKKKAICWYYRYGKSTSDVFLFCPCCLPEKWRDVCTKDTAYQQYISSTPFLRIVK